MSANPIIVASLSNAYPDGIQLYQGQAVELVLNYVFIVKKLGVKLPAEPMPEIYGDSTRYADRIKITAASLPPGLNATNSDDSSRSFLRGTPTTVGVTSVLFKVEVFDWIRPGPGSLEDPIALYRNIGFVSMNLTVLATPTSLIPNTESAVILNESQTLRKGVMASIPLVAATDGYATTYWTVSGLPAGLNLYSGNITGTPEETGEFAILIKLRYKPEGTAGLIEDFKNITLTVGEAMEVSDGLAYIADGATDLFFDLQSRKLSLTLPKAETVLNEGQTLVNGLKAEALLIKTGETMWFNVRFTKGTRVVDPQPTAMRFGVASKIGGPLVMESSSFTKVGSGSAAVFKMRVPTSATEFAAIASDYYDEDAVENPNADGTSQTDDQNPLQGLCEIELTTGTGATIAAIKSETMPVILSRSILA